MRYSKTKKITSACLKRESKNKSRVVRRNSHKNDNTLLEYLRMLFF